MKKTVKGPHKRNGNSAAQQNRSRKKDVFLGQWDTEGNENAANENARKEELKNNFTIRPCWNTYELVTQKVRETISTFKD